MKSWILDNVSKLILSYIKFFKLKITNEIKDKSGNLKFERINLLKIPLLQISLHNFYNPNGGLFDRDDFGHNHPRPFFGLVLKGGYTEKFVKSKNNLNIDYKVYSAGSFTRVNREKFHKIYTLDKSGYCQTICVFYGKRKPWGYLVSSEKISGGANRIIDNSEYRLNKSTYTDNNYWFTLFKM